jgi:hypothetical protein
MKTAMAASVIAAWLENQPFIDGFAIRIGTSSIYIYFI